MVKTFCEKKIFVGNSYTQYLPMFMDLMNISSNCVNFFTNTHRFHSVKFWVGLFSQKMKMQLFGNDVIFFVIACLSVR